VCIYLIFAL
jgi:hypothetical protein